MKKSYLYHNLQQLLLLLFLCFSIGLPISSLAAGPSQPAGQHDRAMTLTGEGRYEEAIKEYRLILRDNPKDIEARVALARILSWTKKYDESIEEYREVLALRPTNEINIELANVLSWAGRFDEAIIEYKAILDREKDNPAALLGLANLYNWTGRDRDSIKYYKRVIELEPDSSDARQGLAQVYKRMGIESGVELRYDLYRNSTEFQRENYTLDITYLLSEEIKLNIGPSYYRFEEASGRSISRHTFPLMLDYIINENLSTHLGYTFNDYSKDAEDTQAYFVGIEFKDERVDFNIAYSQYDIIDNIDPFSVNYYSTLNTIDAIIQDIDTREYRGSLGSRITDNVTASLDLSYGDYSDNNEVLSGSGRLIYRISSSPYFVIGYNLYYADYKFESPYYWSPEGYDSHGLYLNLAHEKGRLTYNIEDTLFFQPDDSAWGNTVLIDLRYRLTERLEARTGLFYFDPDLEDGGSFSAWNVLAGLRMKI